MYKARLQLYDSIIASNPNFERKGKTMPYTSANGHMFSQLNKLGEIGIRLSKKDQHTFFEKYKATEFKSYGAVMNGYVTIPEELLTDTNLVAETLQKGYEFVMSLPSK